MKITHNNKEYELDVEQSLNLGVLKECFKNVKAGDVFVSSQYENSPIKILVAHANLSKSGHQGQRYVLIGNCGANAWDAGYGSQTLTIEQVEHYLANGWKLVGNINNHLDNLLAYFKG